MKLQVPFLHRKSPRPTPGTPAAASSATSAASKSSSSKSLQDTSSPCKGACSRVGGSCGGKKASSKRKSGPLPPSKVLSPAQIRELEEAFNVFDVNRDGKISVLELGSVLRSLGDNPTEQEVVQMVRDVDKDGDGHIDLGEFLILHSNSETNRDELREAFRVFDADKNGFISAEELHGVLKSLGQRCTVEDCRRMIRGVDEDGDGLVNFEEFQKMMI